MKRYIDQNGALWAFEDADSQEAIDRIASKRGVTLTPISEAEYTTIINPPPTLADVRAAKINSLTASYAGEITGDVEYNGVIYQGNQRSLDALMIRLQLGTDPPYWRAKNNNNTTPFTLTDVAAIAKMIELRAAAATEKLHSKKDAVLAAESIEAVQSITWAD